MVEGLFYREISTQRNRYLCQEAEHNLQMAQSDHTETRIASVYKDENGVLVIIMKDCGTIDEYDVVDLNLVIRSKAMSEPRLKLLIATGDWDMTRKAREMALKEDHLSQTKARAIVVSNALKASIRNFLNQFSEKEYPQQFFNNREEAYLWLLSMRTPGHHEVSF